MPIQIQNGVYLDIQVNEQPLPNGHNIFKSLEMHSGFGFAVPVAKLSLYDMHDLFSGGPMNLVDGTKVKAIFTKSQEVNEPIEYNMIVFGKVKSTPIAQGYERSVTLVPDMPSFLIEAQRDFHTGTSTDAIGQICSKHGIELDSDVQANDSMNWLNIGKTHSSYIRDILRRSYSGEQTCVTGSLEWNGIYRVRDLFKQLDKEPETLFFNLKPVSDIERNINFLESEPDSSSGLFNVLTNYGHKHVQHNLAGENSVYSEAKPLVMGAGLPLNSDIKNSIDLTTLTNGRFFDSGQKPLSGGNLHEYYYESEYLNLRHLSLFTESVRGLTDSFNDLPLYSVVNYDHSENRGNEVSLNSAYSGKYLVGNKTLVIRESNYAEIYELHRCFIEEAGTTPLEASDNSSSVTKKTTAVLPTAVNPVDPQRSGLAATQQNTKVKAAPVAELSEQKKLARDLGELAEEDIEEVPVSSVDQFIMDAKSTVNNVFDTFKEQGEAFKNSAILDKYGPSADQLDSAAREFQSAMQKLNSVCSELLPSELGAINLFGPDIGGVIGTILDRVATISQAQNTLQTGIQNLINSGNIPESFLRNPKVRSNCAALNVELEEIHRGTQENITSLSGSCMDTFTMAQLFGPNRDLTRKLREYERLLDVLLCANGDEPTGAAAVGPAPSTLTNIIT